MESIRSSASALSVRGAVHTSMRFPSSSPQSLAQWPTAAPQAGGRASAHGSRVGKGVSSGRNGKVACRAAMMFKCSKSRELCCCQTP